MCHSFVKNSILNGLRNSREELCEDMVRVEQAEFQGRSPPPVMDAAPSPPTYRSLNGKRASNAGERGQLNGAPRTSYSTIAKTNDVEQEITPIPPEASHNLSRLQIILLGIVVASGRSYNTQNQCALETFFSRSSTAYIVWGILISLQPPFYPLEAEKKGVEPHQVRRKHLSELMERPF